MARRFEAAIRAGNVRLLHEFLAAHGLPTCALSTGDTPLTLAVRSAGKHKAALVQALLDAGADVSGPTWDGDTPLSCAAQVGDLETAKLLVSAGADVRFTGQLPALVVAAREGHDQLVDFFATLAPGQASESFALNGERHFRQRPVLQLALESEKCNVRTVECLITHGAKVDVRSQGRTPLQTAWTTMVVNDFQFNPDIVAALMHAGADAAELDPDVKRVPQSRRSAQFLECWEILRLISGNEADLTKACR
mmetsp:Transcript_12302/g.26375  ORF Transcript_12302/g.26375 Transcript_12302/m.26375 type:complete len:251 (+) Transcript_12302:8-760(+)